MGQRGEKQNKQTKKNRENLQWIIMNGEGEFPLSFWGRAKHDKPHRLQ